MVSVILFCLLLVTCQATSPSESEIFPIQPLDYPNGYWSGLNVAIRLLSDRASGLELPNQEMAGGIDAKSWLVRALRQIRDNEVIHEQCASIIRAFLIGSHSKDFSADSHIDPVKAFLVFMNWMEPLGLDNKSMMISRKRTVCCTVCGHGQISFLSQQLFITALPKFVKKLFSGTYSSKRCTLSGCNGRMLDNAVQVRDYFWGTPENIYVQIPEGSLPIKIVKIIKLGEKVYRLSAMIADTSLAKAEHYSLLVFNEKRKNGITNSGQWNDLKGEELFLQVKETQRNCSPLLLVYKLKQHNPTLAGGTGPEIGSDPRSLIATALDHILPVICPSLSPALSHEKTLFADGSIAPSLGEIFQSLFTNLPQYIQKRIAPEFIMAEMETCQVSSCNHHTLKNFASKFYFSIKVPDNDPHTLQSMILLNLVPNDRGNKLCCMCHIETPHTYSPYLASWPEGLLVIELLNSSHRVYIPRSLTSPDNVLRNLVAFITRRKDQRLDLYLATADDSWTGPSGEVDAKIIGQILVARGDEVSLWASPDNASPCLLFYLKNY